MCLLRAEHSSLDVQNDEPSDQGRSAGENSVKLMMVVAEACVFVPAWL